MHKKVMIVLFVMVMLMSSIPVHAAGTSINQASPAPRICYNLNGYPLKDSEAESLRSLLVRFSPGNAGCGSYWVDSGTVWKWDQNASVWLVVVSVPSLDQKPTPKLDSNEVELITGLISGKQVEIGKYNRGKGYLYTIKMCASGRYQMNIFISRSSGYSERSEQGIWQVVNDQGGNYLQLTSSSDGSTSSFPVRINTSNWVESNGDFDFVVNEAVSC